MNILEAIILGIIQGLTEFLPVSSSGHIELGVALLGVETTDNLLFSVVVHAATALSTIIIFRNDIAGIIRGLFSLQLNDSWLFAFKVILSMIPAALVGFTLKDQIEGLFGGNVLLVGFTLLFTGLLLTLTYWAKLQKGLVTPPKALVIGIAQAVAILPGISRSGATISTALLMNVNKEEAARFSFLMVLPVILGASLKEYLEYTEQVAVAGSGGIGALALIAGFVAAFVSGLLACQWMLRIVKKGKLIYFAYYCFAVGTLAIISAIWM